MAAVAAVLVVLVGGIATTTVGYLQARESERQARDAEAEARATVDFLTFDFLALDPQGGTGGQNVTIREALDAAAPKIDQATAQQPRVEAAICHDQFLSHCAQFFRDRGELLHADNLRAHFSATINWIARGITSNTAGSFPTSSPSTLNHIPGVELTATFAARR